MRDLVYTAFASLDGVVDSPGGGPGEEHRSGGWVFKDIEFNEDASRFKVEELEDTTALMLAAGATRRSRRPGGPRRTTSSYRSCPVRRSPARWPRTPSSMVGVRRRSCARARTWLSSGRPTESIFVHGSARSNGDWRPRASSTATTSWCSRCCSEPARVCSADPTGTSKPEPARDRGLPERHREDGLRRRGLSQVQGDGAAAALAKLSRGAADVAAQRARQMRLVEVSESGDDLGRRDAARQESRCRARAFDLPQGALSEPGRGAEPAFDGASRERWPVASAHLGRRGDPGPGPQRGRDDRPGPHRRRDQESRPRTPSSRKVRRVASSSSRPPSTRIGVGTARSEVPTSNSIPTKVAPSGTGAAQALVSGPVRHAYALPSRSKNTSPS